MLENPRLRLLIAMTFLKMHCNKDGDNDVYDNDVNDVDDDDIVVDMVIGGNAVKRLSGEEARQ